MLEVIKVVKVSKDFKDTKDIKASKDLKDFTSNDSLRKKAAPWWRSLYRYISVESIT